VPVGNSLPHPNITTHIATIVAHGACCPSLEQ
jgi:hypothetical protein